MIEQVIQQIRKELTTIPDFKGVYVGEPISVVAVGYPICYVEGGYGIRITEALKEKPYIAGGKVFDEIYSFVVTVEIIFEETLENSLLIYTLVDKVRDKLRNNFLEGLIYNIVLQETDYPYKKERDTLLLASRTYIECILKRQI